MNDRGQWKTEVFRSFEQKSYALNTHDYLLWNTTVLVPKLRSTQAGQYLVYRKVKGAQELKNTGITFTALGAGSIIAAMVASGTSLNATAAFGTQDWF